MLKTASPRPAPHGAPAREYATTSTASLARAYDLLSARLGTLTPHPAADQARQGLRDTRDRIAAEIARRDPNGWNAWLHADPYRPVLRRPASPTPLSAYVRRPVTGPIRTAA